MIRLSIVLCQQLIFHNLTFCIGDIITKDSMLCSIAPHLNWRQRKYVVLFALLMAACTVFFHGKRSPETLCAYGSNNGTGPLHCEAKAPVGRSVFLQPKNKKVYRSHVINRLNATTFHYISNNMPILVERWRRDVKTFKWKPPVDVMKMVSKHMSLLL